MVTDYFLINQHHMQEIRNKCKPGEKKGKHKFHNIHKNKQCIKLSS